MGFKGKEHLTSAGYKHRHKEKQSIANIISPNHKIYKQYKKMYDRLHRKYTFDQQSIAISTIMSRSSMPSRISSQSNRQLALLDADKLLSLSIGTIKVNDQRFGVMRFVIQTSQNTNLSRYGNIFADDRPTQRNTGDFFQMELQRRQRRRRLERLEFFGRERDDQRQRILRDRLITFRPNLEQNQRPNIFQRGIRGEDQNNPFLNATGIVRNILDPRVQDRQENQRPRNTIQQLMDRFRNDNDDRPNRLNIFRTDGGNPVQAAPRAERTETMNQNPFLALLRTRNVERPNDNTTNDNQADQFARNLLNAARQTRNLLQQQIRVRNGPELGAVPQRATIDVARPNVIVLNDSQNEGQPQDVSVSVPEL